MGGDRSSSNNKSRGKSKAKKQPQQRTQKSANRKPVDERKGNKNKIREEEEEIDLLFQSTNEISSDLQQVLLNIFKYALFSDPAIEQHASTETATAETTAAAADDGNNEKQTDLHTQIQTLKTHLYNRDFESAFTDASPSLLRAYALRWSASRCLAYSGLFKGVVDYVLASSSNYPNLDNHGDSSGVKNEGDEEEEEEEEDREVEELRALCIGGGAGAEIVALAGVWRTILDEIPFKEAESAIYRLSTQIALAEEEERGEVGDRAESLSKNHDEQLDHNKRKETDKKMKINKDIKKLTITAVDIAGWSDVIQRIDKAIHSAEVPGCKTYSTPLIRDSEENAIDISFQHLDILSLSEGDLKSLLSHSSLPPPPSSSSSLSSKNSVQSQLIISLMFTLNELFSTSIAKTTQLLLRITDIASPGTILLVVDSPGSYSTLSFSKPDPESSSSSPSDKQQQRQYPMKFLLDHTLLSVAAGTWEKLVSQDSRWFRRDANSKLHYNVDLEGGQGFIKLEDMRCQIHVYRRLSSLTSKGDD